MISCRPSTVRVLALFSMAVPCAWGFRISSEAAFLDEAPRFTVDENCERLSRTYQDICKRSPFIDAYSGTGESKEELLGVNEQETGSSWLQNTFDRLHTLKKELAAFAQCPSNYRVEEEAVLRSHMTQMDNQATAVLEGGNQSSARNVGAEADDSLSVKLKRLAAALEARFALHHFFPSEEACSEEVSVAPGPAERSSVAAAPFFQMRAAKAWRRCLSVRRSFSNAGCGRYMHAKQVWRAELKFFRSQKRNEDEMKMNEEKEMAEARNHRHANAESEMFDMWIPVVEEAMDFVRKLELRKAGAVLLQNRTRLMVGVAAKMGILEEQEGSSEDGSSLGGTSAEVSESEVDSEAADTHRNARARDRAELASRLSQVRSLREEIEVILFDERTKQEARAAARHGTERARLLAPSVTEDPALHQLQQQEMELELEEGDEGVVNDVPLPTEEGGPLRRVWEIIALLERTGPTWMEGLEVTVNQKQLAKLERQRQKLLAFAEQAVDTLEKLEVAEAEQVGSEGSDNSLSVSAAEQLAVFRAAEEEVFEAKLSALFSSKSATEWAAHDLGLLAGREAVESWEASHRKAMSMDDTREAILDKIWARTSPALEGDAGSLEDDVMEDVDKQFQFLSLRLEHRQSAKRLESRLRKLRSARRQRDGAGTQERTAGESEEETAFHAAFLDGYQFAWREKTVDSGLQLGRSGLESLETGVRALDAYAEYCKAELKSLVIDDITRQVEQEHGLMKEGVAAFGALCGHAWTGSVPAPAGGRPGDMTNNEAEIWEWLESSPVAQQLGVAETIEKVQESLYYLIPRENTTPELEEEQGLEASLLPADNMEAMHAAIKQVKSNVWRGLLVPSAAGRSKREKTELVKVLVNAERDRGLLKAWDQNWHYAAQLGLVRQTRSGPDEVASWQAASPAERVAAKSVDGAWGFILLKFLVSAFGGGGLSVRRVRQEPFPGVLLKDTVHLDMLELPAGGRNKVLKNPSSGDGGKAVRLMLLRFRRMGMRRAVLREGVGGGHLGLGQGERERFSAAVASAKEKGRESEESGRGVWSTSDRMLYLWNNVVETGAGDGPRAVHDQDLSDEQKAQKKLLESEIPEALRSLENWKTLSTTDRVWWLGGEVASPADTPQTPMNVVFEQGLTRLLKKFMAFQASEQLAEPTTGRAFFNAYQAVLELCGYRPIHANFAALREYVTGVGGLLNARDMVIPLFAHDYWHGRSMDGRGQEQDTNSVGEIFVDDSERALSQARMLFLLKKVMIMEAVRSKEEQRKRWGVESPAEWTEWIVQRMLAGGGRHDEIQQQGHQGQLQGSSAAARQSLCDLGRDDDSGGRCCRDVRSSRRQEEAALLCFGSSLSSSPPMQAQDGGDPPELVFQSAPEWVSLVAQQGERQADECGENYLDENASLLQQYESVIEEHLSNGTGSGLVGLFEMDEALWLRSEVKPEVQELRRSKEADRKKAGRMRNSKASAAAARRRRLEEGSKALEELRNASLENLRQRDDIMRNRWKLWIVAKYRVILKKKSVFQRNGSCTAESLASLQDQLSHLQAEQFVAGQDGAVVEKQKLGARRGSSPASSSSRAGAVAASKMKGVDDDVRQILDTFVKPATNAMAKAAMGRLSSSSARELLDACAVGSDFSFRSKELLDAFAENALALAVVANQGDRPLKCDQVETTQGSGKICEAEEELH